MNVRRTVVAVSVLMGLVATPSAASELVRPTHRGLESLVPNIQTMQPMELRVVTDGGVRRLRFTNLIANVGAGPIELQPRKHDCDGDGNPANDREAIQRIYHDVNGDGVFGRGVDTAVETRVAGCFEFSVAHGHWHFHDYASYELVDVVSGAVVASNDKVGFCLLDTFHPYPGVPGSPDHRYYRGCQRNSVQGESVGFADVYQWYLPGQWIDVTGKPNGEYCLVTTADPANQILESNDGDNAYRQRIRLTGSAVVPLTDTC